MRLNKNFVPCSFTLSMASKTKAGSFYGLIRPLFLVLVHGFQQGNILKLDKMLVSMASVIAAKFITEF